jgi:hypothetical protein
MILPLTPDRGTSLLAIEVALTLLVVALAFSMPRLGSSTFARIEQLLARLAQRRGLAVLCVAVVAAALRLALLPFLPIPNPFILDAFSYLLAADTFASARLTNPTPVMWTHFESFQITMQPTYMSMYFPAHGMVLAMGKVLFGHPWFGLLLTTAAMCGAICWMLQAWLPPTWALLGGCLAVMRLGLFSYWINTYSGGASIAALGGALVLGAMPRLMKRRRVHDAAVLAIGVIILANSRPYEGFLLCLPLVFVLGRWTLLEGKQFTPAQCLRLSAVPVILFVVAASWMGYYNHRVFGNAFTEPYQVNRATYAIAPHFVWQQAHPVPAYRHAVMRDFYSNWELNEYKKVRTIPGFVSEIPIKLARAILFFAGFAMLPPLLMLGCVVRDRRIRILLVCVVVLAVGMLMETWLIPHYLSPFTAAFYAIGLQAARHLRVWRVGGEPVGLGMIRMLTVLCIVLVGLRTFAEPLHLKLAAWPTWSWSGSTDLGIERASMEAAVNRLPGKQLILVKYAASHDSLNEWVYNSADIDASHVIWARSMEPADDTELINFYKDRRVWLVEPDSQPVRLQPYVLPANKGLSIPSLQQRAANVANAVSGGQ